MNSIVQCLSNTAPLKFYLEGFFGEDDEKTRKVFFGRPVLEGFVQLIQQLWTPGYPVDTDHFKVLL